MNRRYRRLLSGERGLWLTGLAGLTAAIVYACSGDDTEKNSADSSSGSAAASGQAGAAPAASAGHAATSVAGASGSNAGTAALRGGSSAATGSMTAAAPSSASSDAGPAAASSTTPATAHDAGASQPVTTAASDAGQHAAVDAGTPATPADPSSCDNNPKTAANTSAVVDATKALLAALTPEQQKAIAFDKTLANAQKWSNLPTSFVPRNGVKMSDMSDGAQKAAVALVQAAAGGTGSTLFSEVREADEWLVTDGQAGTTDYGRDLYYFAIHGTPSTSTAWMLQVAGHHLAYNFTYAGKCTSATPLFDGVEPMKWTSPDGKQHAPLEAQRASVVALLTAIASKPEAKLAGTFSDLIAGPVGGGPPGLGGPPGMGGGDINYPNGIDYPTGSSGRGAQVSKLSAAEQALVKTAIEAWVKNVADPVSSALLAAYESDEAFAQTYVAYSGSPDLTTQASYARIDGPRVWIEFTVQGGIIYRDKVHYHTIWRDKKADYGAEYVSK